MLRLWCYQVDRQCALEEWQGKTDKISCTSDNGNNQDDEQIPTYAESRRKQKYYQAESTQLKYEIAKGDLVDKLDVEYRIKCFLSDLKAQLLMIPPQVSPLLAAETDEFNIRALLYGRIDALLNKIVNNGKSVSF